jgi:hypothetical protein
VIITTQANAQTWFNYASALARAQRHREAASAYRKVLDYASANRQELEPLKRSARLEYATALAQASILGQADGKVELRSFLEDLVQLDPGLTVTILERPECQPLLADPKFEALRKQAKTNLLD